MGALLSRNDPLIMLAKGSDATPRLVNRSDAWTAAVGEGEFQLKPLDLAGPLNLLAAPL